MKPINSLGTFDLLIKHKVDVYDKHENKISILEYMGDYSLYDVWIDIQKHNIFYNPADLEG